MDWIVPDCYKKLTPNRYFSEYKPEKIEPIEAIVYHYTASLGTSGTLGWLTDSTAKVSAHFLISRDGTCYQLAPLCDRTWHAGGATSNLFNRSNVNGRTLGIEIMNVGPLVEVAGKIFATIDMAREFKGPIYKYGGSEYKYSLWEEYPQTQLDAVLDITRQLVNEFPIIKESPMTRLIGHEDVDPSRKLDPGPAYPWDIVRAFAA